MKKTLFAIDRIEGSKAVLRSPEGEILVDVSLVSGTKEGDSLEVSIVKKNKPQKRIKTLIKKVLK